MPWEVHCKRPATEQQSELQPAKMPKLQPTQPQEPPPDHLWNPGSPIKPGPLNQEQQRLAALKKVKESLTVKESVAQQLQAGFKCLKPGMQEKEVAQQLPERVEMKEDEVKQEQQKQQRKIVVKKVKVKKETVKEEKVEKEKVTEEQMEQEEKQDEGMEVKMKQEQQDEVKQEHLGVEDVCPETA
jgi:hypothetical protein